MQGPVTRTFLRTEDGVRHFLEISWQGPEVEVVTGRVGTAGRATPKVFESVEERDAFVAKRIARALREGFVEGAPTDVPAPEPPDSSARRVGMLRKKHETTAWIPEVEDDDARDVSKLGGTPWFEPDGTWPACGGCAQPLRFVMQLAAADVPEPARWALRSDLLQLFVCDAQGRAGDPEWLCQAEGGWEPFAPSTVVRHVSCGGTARDLREALPAALLEVRRRRWLESMASYCRQSGDEASARAWDAKIASGEVEPKSWDVPESVQVFRVEQSFLFPARRVVAWTSVPDVPAFGDIDLDDVDALAEHGLRCKGGDKLGGHPRWAQSPAVPRCRSCRAPMRYLMQLVSEGNVPMGFGGDGLGWMFVCPKCREATFTWQR